MSKPVQENKAATTVTSKEADLSSIPPRCWVILFVCSTGVLMASISTTALVIAFRALLEYLDTPITTMLWVLLVVFLMIGGVVAIAGKLGDIIGQAALYKFGYFMFVAGSLIAGFSQKKNKGLDLLGARIIIGFGAAFLFVNSSAILTNAFAPYGRVGLAQGIYQIASASGTVLGPVIGGALANQHWHWIFWWNVPVGGVAFLLSLWAVNENIRKVDSTLYEFAQKFDWIGAFFYPAGLVLILLALIQVVIPDKHISQTGPLAGVIVAGVSCAIIFVVDQFYAKDPLIPPDMFKNKIFTITAICNTCASFVRNSITYNFIFYLQGPKSQSPLTAGLMLIPYGIGIMIAGFAAGNLADKVQPRFMTVVGPIIVLAAVCTVVISFDQKTGIVTIGGLLFLCGIGLGIFNSPNILSNMLSVERTRRGVAGAINMLSQMFTSMLAIVLTFSFVLNSMSQAELFDLFIYGGTSLSSSALNSFLLALKTDWYIVIGALVLIIVMSCFNDFDPHTNANHVGKQAMGPELAEGEAKERDEDQQHHDIEMAVVATGK